MFTLTKEHLYQVAQSTSTKNYNNSYIRNIQKFINTKRNDNVDDDEYHHQQHLRLSRTKQKRKYEINKETQ